MGKSAKRDLKTLQCVFGGGEIHRADLSPQLGEHLASVGINRNSGCVGDSVHLVEGRCGGGRLVPTVVADGVTQGGVGVRKALVVVAHHRVREFQQQVAVVDAAFDPLRGRGAQIVGPPFVFAARTEQP